MGGRGHDVEAALRCSQRRRWIGVALVAGVATALAGTLLFARGGTRVVGRWALVVVPAVFGTLGWLKLASSPSQSAVGSATIVLTAPMLVTAGRAVCVALLAGFLLVPPLSGWIGWIPWLLYALIAGGDALDGALARATDTASAIGARFDNEVDALGLLVASLVGIHLGAVPRFYLVAGLLRYLFVGGIAFRRHRGATVEPLPIRRHRRHLAALQMAFLVVALLPPVGGPAVTVLAAAVLLPFVAGFARDWGYVSGRVPHRSRPSAER